LSHGRCPSSAAAVYEAVLLVAAAPTNEEEAQNIGRFLARSLRAKLASKDWVNHNFTISFGHCMHVFALGEFLSLILTSLFVA